MFYGDKNATKYRFLVIFDIVVILTFDFLNSQCNQFICVPKYTKVVNLLKLSKRFIRYCVQKLQDAHTN